MKSFRFPFYVLFGLLIIAQSCSYKKRNILFKTKHKIETNQAIDVVDSTGITRIKPDSVIYRHRIKVGDRLNIRFLQNYDLGQASFQGATSNQLQSGVDEKGYLINYDSTVTLPLIGRVNLVGMTRLSM